MASESSRDKAIVSAPFGTNSVAGILLSQHTPARIRAQCAQAPDVQMQYVPQVFPYYAVRMIQGNSAAGHRELPSHFAPMMAVALIVLREPRVVDADS